MTMTIELTPEQEARLRERAWREGRDAEALAAALICAGIGLSELAPPGNWDGCIGVVDSGKSDAPQTLDVTLAGRVGQFRSAGKTDVASNTGEAFVDLLMEKHRL